MSTKPPTRRGAPAGNQNAKLPDAKSSRLFVRCRPADKARWVKAARGTKLSEWIERTLNRASRGIWRDSE